MSLELPLGISYVESSNASGIFVEREEVQICSLCCGILVHSLILPSSSVQPFCISIATLWLLCISGGSPRCSLFYFEVLTRYVWITEETICIVVTSMIFNRWSIMVYETKLPRQASTSTVTEDCSENSEVPLRRGRGLEHQPWSTQDRRQWLSSSGAELSQSCKDMGL